MTTSGRTPSDEPPAARLGRKSRITFHFPDSDIPNAGLDDLPLGLRAATGFPEEIFEFNNVFLVRGADCFALYDESGHRIDVSATHRGVKLQTFVKARERIEPPSQYLSFDAPVLFLSKYVGLWGHLITETSSRLWARHQFSELAKLPALFAGAAWLDQPYAANLFAYFPDLRIQTFREFKPPLKLRHVFVPAPSFINRAAAYSGHLTALHEAADRMLSGVKAESDPRPVYFSRTRLDHYTRAFENERELEAVLETRGFRIVYPETLDVREQVQLVNAHRVFVGIVGSAMHNLLFALRGEDKITHLLCCPSPQENYLLTDAIVGNESHHVGVCRPSGDDATRFILDAPAALAYLRQQGLL